MSIDNKNLKRIALVEKRLDLVCNSIAALTSNLDEIIRLYEKFVEGFKFETGPSVYPPYFNKQIVSLSSTHDSCDICGMQNPIENNSNQICEDAKCLYGNSIARLQK